jgi:septal ring-binding cell division protein DamX
VQVIAMRSEENVLKYASLNGMQYPLYTRIANDDGPWYVLLLGVYPDVNTARQAMTDWLRAKSLKVDPWVRQLGALQASIRRAQQYE